MIKRSVGYALKAKSLSLFQYRRVLRKMKRTPPGKGEESFDAILSGYPRNHDYRLRGGELFPGFRLFERFRLVRALYPDKMESFLDVGCCRGFYTLDAALRQGCRLSAGMDVFKPFVSISTDVKIFFKIENAYFYNTSLDEMANRIDEFGGPFQTVLTIGTYHYLFWGSKVDPTAFFEHREILSRLSRICGERLIFSARLEVDRLPDWARDRARNHEKRGLFTTENFLREAESFFQVRESGFLGAYPLFLMIKRG